MTPVSALTSITGRRGCFLIVVVLGLPARKAIDDEHDDEDDIGKTFRPGIHQRIEDENEHEHEHDWGKEGRSPW
jgi:hypothetical protein